MVRRCLKNIYTQMILQPWKNTVDVRKGYEKLVKTDFFWVYKGNVQCLKILYYKNGRLSGERPRTY